MVTNPAIARGRARYAALSRWAAEPDPVGATKAARDGFLAKFERQVDPEGKLSPEERTRRALIARRAHMQLLAVNRMVARAARQAQKSAAGNDSPVALGGGGASASSLPE